MQMAFSQQATTSGKFRGGTHLSIKHQSYIMNGCPEGKDGFITLSTNALYPTIITDQTIEIGMQKVKFRHKRHGA